MQTTISKTFQVKHPLKEVWAFLSNPEQVVTCVPGASIVEKLDDRNFKGEVTLKFGPISAKYNGQLTIEELDEANRRMVLKGKGLDAKGKGSADMTMTGILTEKDGGTEVNYTMDVGITGMLAQFGSRVITDVSNHLFGIFVNNFMSQIEGKSVEESELSAGSMVGDIMKKKLGGLFGKKD